MRKSGRAYVLLAAIALVVLLLAGSCDTTHTSIDAGPDADADGDRDIDSDRDQPDGAGDGDSDGDADGDNPCLPDPDSDADTDTDTDTDTDSDVDGDVDGDVDADADADADSGDADILHDGDVELDPCPEDMVAVGRFCIDIWEASRFDATSTSQGVDTSVACSRPGVLPWFENPMSADALDRFEAACAAAGKRLCTTDEWSSACSGPAGSLYVFGDTFDVETCNCVDTYCDDHCADVGIPEAECVTTANCGYTYSCYHVVPTGSFPSCTNELGTFDISGNLWEVVPSRTDGRGYEVRGGAFNCASAAARLQCTFNAGWDALYAGFRCCKDR